MDDETKLQFVNTFASLITAAFGLVAALAWNETIKGVINVIFESPDNLLGNFVYAILVTTLAVVMSVLIARSAKKLNDQIKASGKKE